MVAGAPFTGIHCSSCGGGGAGGGGVLVVRIVRVRSGSCLQVSLNGAKNRQKTGVLRISVRFLCTILGICTGGSDLHASLLAPIFEWRGTQAKNRCVVHVCSFFQATSHDQLGDPGGGYTCPCYPAENTTYDVNQSAMEWRSRQAFQKTGMLAPRLLFCRYQGFVEQHQDPQVEDGRIMGSAFPHGTEDRQKNRCVLLVTFLQVTNRQLMHIYGIEAAGYRLVQDGLRISAWR